MVYLLIGGQLNAARQILSFQNLLRELNQSIQIDVYTEVHFQHRTQEMVMYIGLTWIYKSLTRLFWKKHILLNFYFIQQM